MARRRGWLRAHGSDADTGRSTCSIRDVSSSSTATCRRKIRTSSHVIEATGLGPGKNLQFSLASPDQEKTTGGLQKANLMKNKRGKVVSKKMHAKGKSIQKFVQGWLSAVATARKELGIKGFCVIGGKSAQGKALYAKAKAIYAA